MKRSAFWDIMPCSPLKVNRRFGKNVASIFSKKPAQREGSSKQSSAVCSSETPINFQRTTRCYIPEDKILHNHGCENFISGIVIVNIIFDINMFKEMGHTVA
jgi:hypothetical protein